MNIFDLPVEIWRLVFSHLSMREKVHMVVADKYFRGAVDAAEIDKAKDQLFCVNCKVAPANGLYENHRCVDCYNFNTNISFWRAMNVFGLTAAELAKVPCANDRSHRDRVTPESVFKFKTVRDAALKKYGKRMCDAWLDLEAERQREKAALEADEARWTEKMRTALAEAGVQFNDKCADVAREYLKTGECYEQSLERVLKHVRAERVRVPRAATLNQRLDALGIDRSYYSEMREKYAKDWAGYRNLDRVVQIVVDTLEVERSDATPKLKLVRALRLRGIDELDTDTRLYRVYMAGKSRLTLANTVERMFEMHLLEKHTNYDQCLEDALEFVIEYRGEHLHNDMTYCCEDLSNHCLAALGAVDEATVHSGPLCRCGLSTRVVRSQAALDYVHCLGHCGVPQWMQY